jgi:cohesin complex subunit SA-1/2
MQDAHVRQTAVIALRNLYEVEDNIASLELFTQRFSGRMLELAEDIDEHVAVEAVKLIKELLR